MCKLKVIGVIEHMEITMAHNIVKIIKGITICAAFCSSLSFAQTLRVGTEATYAPFEFTENGKLTGYDVEIMQAIGKAQGYDVEFVNMPFDGLIPALITSQIDTVIAAMSITPERAQKVDFSEPYYNSGISLIIRAADKDKYKDVASLKGKRLCAQIGSTGAMNAEKISPKNVAAFNTEPEAFMELSSNGCEAVVNDRPVNLYYIAKTNANVVELPELMSAEQYGIAVKKGNDKVKAIIDAGLEKIKASGEFAKIHEKWFKVAQ